MFRSGSGYYEFADGDFRRLDEKVHDSIETEEAHAESDSGPVAISIEECLENPWQYHWLVWLAIYPTDRDDSPILTAHIYVGRLQHLLQLFALLRSSFGVSFATAKTWEDKNRDDADHERE